MICCLNPDCLNPLNPDGTSECQSCSTALVSLLREHYRIVKPLGQGGFGRTYLAEDTDKLNQHCVVKQLAPNVQGTWVLNKAVQLFEQEAGQLQALGEEHPQIPGLYGYFEENGHFYMVQQFIDGQNLSQLLQQQGIWSEGKIRQLLLDLLPVLTFIHSRQVIHRDIKPENIIRHSRNDRLVLIDFGVSKQLSATVMTKPGTQIGTPGYAPLEQMHGGEAYAASDLFSLGATCFHLLTGVSPSELWTEHGYGWTANWRQHLQSPVNHELGKVLDKLLQKDVGPRYQSAKEVIRDLQLTPSASSGQASSSQSSLPTQAISPTLSQKKQKVKFNKLLLVGGAILLSGFVGTQIYSFFRYGLSTNNIILEKTLTGHSSWVNSVAIGPDGKTLASGYGDGTIALWALDKFEEIATLKEHSDEIRAVAISPDGKILASGSDDKTIKLWNLETYREIATLKGRLVYPVRTITISPDSKTLASHDGGYIKLWNLETFEVMPTSISHSNSVRTVTFSPDGKTLVSASLDGTIKIWRMP